MTTTTATAAATNGAAPPPAPCNNSSAFLIEIDPNYEDTTEMLRLYNKALEGIGVFVSANNAQMQTGPNSPLQEMSDEATTLFHAYKAIVDLYVEGV